MHFIMSETEVEKINSTSLNNSEVDNIIRKLKPHLFVKIIDACQSGLRYIKNIQVNGNEENCLSTKGFENCIFLYSSKSNQYSYADDKYSEFTRHILDAIHSQKSKSVRYIDIQNYLTDVFQRDNKEQTPYFNTQCDGTEIFCEKNHKVCEVLKNINKESISKDSDDSKEKIEQIKRYLQISRTEEQVSVIMNDIQSVMQDNIGVQGWIKEFYDVSCSNSAEHLKHTYREETSILKLLVQKSRSENLFVNVQYQQIEKKNQFNPFTVNYVNKPVSYYASQHSLPEFINYSFKAKNSSLPDYEVPFVFIYSPTYFYVFTSIKQFIQKGWKEYIEQEGTKYVYKKFLYHDFKVEEWRDFIEGCLKESEQFMEKTVTNYVSQ